eukprot:COSAG06_NODE_1206_length_10270_cov_8.055255_7_plen_38_part_00
MGLKGLRESASYIEYSLGTSGSPEVFLNDESWIDSLD